MAQQQQTIAMVRGWQVLGGGRSSDGPSSNRQQSERASSRAGYSATSQPNEGTKHQSSHPAPQRKVSTASITINSSSNKPQPQKETHEAPTRKVPVTSSINITP